jgi:hypothetical protein
MTLYPTPHGVSEVYVKQLFVGYIWDLLYDMVTWCAMSAGTWPKATTLPKFMLVTAAGQVPWIQHVRFVVYTIQMTGDSGAKLLTMK